MELSRIVGLKQGEAIMQCGLCGLAFASASLRLRVDHERFCSPVVSHMAHNAPNKEILADADADADLGPGPGAF